MRMMHNRLTFRNNYAGNKFLTRIATPPSFTADAWYRLGVLRAIELDHIGALEALKHAFSKAHGHMACLHEIAKALHHLGRYDPAVVCNFLVL